MDILADQIIEQAFCIKHSGIILIATYAGMTILIMFEIDFSINIMIKVSKVVFFCAQILISIHLSSTLYVWLSLCA